MIFIKFATRSRPENALRGLRSIVNLAKTPELVQVALSVDLDDPSMVNFTDNQEVIDLASKLYKLHVDIGTSVSKVHAINRSMKHYEKFDWNILICFSDDMVFVQPGWDEVVRHHCYRFPDMDGVLHLNDGFNTNRFMSMSVMTRVYYERQGYIYHPTYKSLWCDVEETEKSIMLKKHKYEPAQIFTHLHPANTSQAATDPLYARNEALWHEDEKTYKYRKFTRNFDV